jgi:hypothetical protein
MEITILDQRAHITLGFYVKTPGNEPPVTGLKPGWGLHIELDCAKARGLWILFEAGEPSRLESQGMLPSPRLGEVGIRPAHRHQTASCGA